MAKRKTLAAPNTAETAAEAKLRLRDDEQFRNRLAAARENWYKTWRSRKRGHRFLYWSNDRIGHWRPATEDGHYPYEPPPYRSWYWSQGPGSEL